MSLFIVQYLKDFKANFSNYNAYIILAVYYILSLFTTIYLGDYFLRESNIMSAFFVMQPVILTFVVPAITMRTWAEEIKTGTIEILLTQPIGYTTLVLAKFFASYSFFLILVFSSLFLGFFSNQFSILDIGIVISGYIGLLLCGALFTAVGCVISIFNKNNILSYATTIFALFAITQSKFTSIGNVSLGAINFEDNFVAFLSGILSLSNILYFVIGTIIFLWLNVLGIYFRKLDNLTEKNLFGVMAIILGLIFVSFQIGSYFCFDKEIDITDEKKFTLMEETKNALKNIDKRIDITLYEAQNAREEANSSYAVKAEFCERLLRLFEKQSNGAVRVNIALVKPFGELERRLIKSGVLYEEDKLGYKKFIGLEITDNEGNYEIIKSLNGLRLNLLEADFLRIIKTFGIKKEQIAIIGAKSDLDEMSLFNKSIRQFYDVDEWVKVPLFIPDIYKTVIVINPSEFSSENMLALEQYIFNGGKVIIFAESEKIALEKAKPVVGFLQNYGIKPKTDNKPIVTKIGNKDTFLSVAKIANKDNFKDVRAVFLNKAGEVEAFSKEKFNAYSLLDFEGKSIGAISYGEYVSDFLDLTFENLEILPFSKKTGGLIFIYDTDLLKDYIYVSDETKYDYFYEIVPTNDNLLFFLRLLNFTTNSHIEDDLRYRHYQTNSSSIGNAILSHVKEKYGNVVAELEEKIATNKRKKEQFYNVLNAKGFASVKNIGELSKFEQVIDEAEDKLNETHALIAKDYQSVIVGLTGVLILVFPLIYLIIMMGILTLCRKVRLKKILEAINNVKAS